MGDESNEPEGVTAFDVGALLDEVVSGHAGVELHVAGPLLAVGSEQALERQLQEVVNGDARRLMARLDGDAILIEADDRRWRLPAVGAKSLRRLRVAIDELARELGLRSRVLVVDDEGDTADLMAALLRRRGHVAEIARTAAEALEAHRAFGPDVCLVDIALPDESGYVLVERLRAQGSTARMLAVTGWAHRESRERAQRVGFDAYFVKPPDLRSLLAAIEEPRGA